MSIDFFHSVRLFMNAIDEAKYADNVSEFVHVFNKRIGCRVKNDDQWVRVSPPDKDMLKKVVQDPRVMPFTRVGAVGKITDVFDGFVTIRIGGDSLMFSHDEFFRTFVRAVHSEEWRSYGNRTRLTT